MNEEEKIDKVQLVAYAIVDKLAVYNCKNEEAMIALHMVLKGVWEQAPKNIQAQLKETLLKNMQSWGEEDNE